MNTQNGIEGRPLQPPAATGGAAGALPGGGPSPAVDHPAVAGSEGANAAPVAPGVLIVWWSHTGASRQLSAAAEAGARSALDALEVTAPERVGIRRLRCDLAGPEDLLAARASLFVAPENLASLAGEMKAFFDRCYYPVLDQLGGRAYAMIIAAGSDGEGAARQLARIATGWRLRAVAEPLIVRTDAQTPAAILAPKQVAEGPLREAHELGATLAAGVQTGLW